MKKLIFILFILISQLGFAQENLDSLLFVAVKNNDLEQVKELVEKGADVNAIDENGASVLMWATYNGNLETVKFLISKNADYKYKKGVIYTNKEKTGYYGNLLGIAAGENHLPILKYFIEDLKIDINDQIYNLSTREEDWAALHYATFKGNNKIIEYLLNKGANININAGDGATPLIIAMMFQKYETAQFLIAKGADVNLRNNSGWTPLHYASRDNEKDIVNLLIEKGAKLNIQTNEGWTPLMLAGYNGNMDIFQILLNHGADINVRNKEGKVVWELKNNSGWTPLHYASRNNQKDIVNLLLEKGANLNIQTNNGLTPLIKQYG